MNYYSYAYRFLLGFKRQFRNMKAARRRIAAGLYVSLMVVTIVGGGRGILDGGEPVGVGVAILACTHSNQTNQLRYAKDPFNNRVVRSEGIQALLQLVALLLHKQASR